MKGKQMKTKKQKNKVGNQQRAVFPLKTRRFKLAILFATILSSAVFLSGCASDADKVSTERITDVHMLDLMELLDKEMNENELLTKHSKSIAANKELLFSGDLFETPVNGEISFKNRDADTNEYVVFLISASFYKKDLSYKDCRQKLINLYGEPFYNEESPYVKNQGGCVSRCRFKAGECEIMLETASEHKTCFISIS